MVDEPWSGKLGAGDRNRTGTGLSALRIFLPATAFAAATRRLWSGLSLHHGVAAVGAARLVSTPSRFQAWLGITSEGFPDFEQFCILGFPGSTQVGLSPLRLPISPRPRAMAFITRAGLVAKVSGERFMSAVVCSAAARLWVFKWDGFAGEGTFGRRELRRSWGPFGADGSGAQLVLDVRRINHLRARAEVLGDLIEVRTFR